MCRAGAGHIRFYVLFIATAWVLALLLVPRAGWAMGTRRGLERGVEGTRPGPETAI